MDYMCVYPCTVQLSHAADPFPVPSGQLRERLERSQMAQQQIRLFKVLHLDFHPRESHLITFQNPWSFPILFHPECNNLVRHHMEEIAEKVGIYTILL